MSDKGNCYDNAMVETFFKTLKLELIWRTIYQTRNQAENAIARYIDDFYNPTRRHSALDYITGCGSEGIEGGRKAIWEDKAETHPKRPTRAPIRRNSKRVWNHAGVAIRATKGSVRERGNHPKQR